MRVLLAGILSSLLLLAACAGPKATGPTTYTFEGVDMPDNLRAPGRKGLVAFHEGLKAKAKGDIDKARELFLTTVEETPENDAAHFELARIFLEQQDKERAALHIDDALRLQPDNQYYLDFKGKLMQGFGKWKASLTIYEKLNDAYPKNAGYYFERAYLYERTGNLLQAIATYNKLEEQIGLEEQVVLHKHRLYLSIKDIDNAAAEIEKLIEAYPNEGRYYGILGEMYEAVGRPSQALEAYQDLLANDPDNPYAALSLANFYRNAGEQALYQSYITTAFEDPSLSIDLKISHLLTYIDIIKVSENRRKDAFTLAKAMVTAHPDEAKGYAMYGDILYNGGEKQAAINAYNNALSLDESVYSVWEQVMYINAELNAFDTLADVSEEAMALFPNQALPYFLNGVANNQQKQHNEALLVLDRALIIGGSNPMLVAEVYAAMGDSYHALKQHNASDSCYQESLKRNPDNAYVLNNYAYYMSLREKNLDQCAEMARRANELSPDNPSFQDTYGWVLFQKGQYEQARQWLEKALNNGGNNSAAILEHYGDVLFKLGQEDAAVDYWNRALEANGDKTLLEDKIKNRKLYE